MLSLQYVEIVKFLLVQELFTNVYKNRPILLFCKCALSPGGNRGGIVYEKAV